MTLIDKLIMSIATIGCLGGGFIIFAMIANDVSEKVVDVAFRVFLTSAAVIFGFAVRYIIICVWNGEFV